MPDLTYRDYRRTARRVGEVLVVHGRYDGLATVPVTHRHAQLFIPLAGRAHVAPARGTGLVIGPEAAVWIPAGVAHAASSLGDVVAFVALNVPAGWGRDLAHAHGLPAPARNPALLRDPGLWLAGRLLADTLADPPGGEAWLDASVLQLGLLALRAGGTAPAPATPIDRLVDRIMRDHPQPLTVAGLAAEAGLGVRQLERRFAEVVGMPPRRFLIAVRLAAARDRLLTGDEPLAAIAEHVGFADATHLTRAFRAVHGTTPAAWRRDRRRERNP